MSIAIKVNARTATHRALRAYAANDQDYELSVVRVARATYAPAVAGWDDDRNSDSERNWAHRCARHMMVVAGTTFQYDLVEVK